MSTKNKIYTRTQQKYDTEEHWSLATGFVPLAGEVVVYAPDENHSSPRVKVGDGITPITALKFIDEDVLAIDYDSSLAFDTTEIVFENSGMASALDP